MTPYLPFALIDSTDRESMARHLDRLCIERDEAELWGHGELAQEQIDLALAECATRGWVPLHTRDGWTVTEKERA